ncbi:polyhydroxyalkanoate depolymerase, intracellular [alpha proteobacterium Q-1]|nr:polyhydroxyalkanoate depolymerase, intracellular [alpha proteobacterium Q-1]
MLYSLYELQHTAVAPARYLADQGQILFRNPLNPMSFTPMGRMTSAALDLFEHSTRRYGKPRFDLDWTHIDGRDVRVTEEIMYRKGFGQIKRFVRDIRRPNDPKVLLVAPMSGHFATLLRGTVEALLPDHDVYITDWRDARDIPLFEGRFDLCDYIDYVIGWLEDIGPKCHVIAVCQPAVPVYAAVARMEAEKNRAAPASITLMGGPIDTRANPTAVNELATTRPLSWFERNVITHVPPPNAGMWRKVYPGFLQLAGFMSMNLGDHMMKHHEFFNHLVEGDGESADATRFFYEEYRSVMDMTAEFYLQTIETVFQTHALPKGEMMHHEHRVDPKAITRTAILCVEGERDDISGIGQTRSALDLASNLDPAKKRYFMAPKVGHYGIFNGRRWREVIAPEVKAFIRQHDGN